MIDLRIASKSLKNEFLVKKYNFLVVQKFNQLQKLDPGGPLEKKQKKHKISLIFTD